VKLPEEALERFLGFLEVRMFWKLNLPFCPRIPRMKFADQGKLYGIELKKDRQIDLLSYDAIILAVAHDEYRDLELKVSDQVVYDIKSVLKSADGKL